MPASGPTEHRIKNFLNTETLSVCPGRGSDTIARVHLEQRSGSMSFSFILTAAQARDLAAALLIAAADSEANCAAATVDGARA